LRDIGAGCTVSKIEEFGGSGNVCGDGDVGFLLLGDGEEFRC
jgi:hypothetical protein